MIFEYQILLDSLESKEIKKIVIAEKNGDRILTLSEIVCIQGDGSYAKISLINGTAVTVSKTLKYFENLLPEGSTFFRSQKSWIINTSYVKQINRKQGNILLKNDILAKISQNKLEEFKLVLSH